MVTIAQIAAKVGISPSEVSRVLNGRERPKRSVSESTRQRVLQTAKELGYQPNLIARSLVTQRTPIVGTVMYNITNPFFAFMAMGLQAELSAKSLQMFLLTAERSERRETDEHCGLALLCSLLRYNVAGVLFWNWQEFTTGDEAYWRSSGYARTPLVLLGWVASDVTMDRVAADYSRGASLLTEHLLGLGHKRIAYIGNDEGYSKPYSKHAGFSEAMSVAGLTPETIYIERPSWEAGRELGHHLASRAQPPTAVIAANDMMATGIMRGLSERGKSVPEFMAVAGFDDAPHGPYLPVSLTSVRPPYGEVVRSAVQLLQERIEATATLKSRCACEPGDCRTILLQPSLVIRESTIGPMAGPA
jgi:DNA-binding LacI/PurR family transcriptional regulator